MIEKQHKLRQRQEVKTKEPPLDPWRHVVLLATFSFLFLEAGTMKSFGVLLSPMVFQLETNFATMGVVFSLPWSVEYMSAVLVKLLVNRIDPNKISIAGGLIAGVTLTLSFFAPTTWVLGTILFIFGIGESMIIVPAVICLHRHYKQQFAFASSFAFIGSLIGVFILPIVTEQLMESYGPRSTLLILGGLSLHMLPIGLVLKLPKERSKRKPVSVRKRLLDSVDNGCSITEKYPSEKRVSQTDHMDCNVLKRPRYDELIKQREYESPDLGNTIDERNHELGQETIKGGRHYNEEGRTESSEPSIGYRDSGVCIEGYSQGSQRPMEWISSLKTFLVEAKLFLLFILPCDFIGAFVLISWTIFIIPYAISIGITESRAVFVATMGGVGGLVARILGTVLLHFHPTWVSGQYVMLCSLTSLMLLIQPLRASYLYILVCSFLLGFGLYGSVCLVEALVSSVVCPKVFPTALSVTYLFKGVGGILTAYTSGSLYDLTGSFKIVFHILGALEAVNVGIILLLITIKKRSNTRHLKDPEQKEEGN